MAEITSRRVGTIERFDAAIAAAASAPLNRQSAIGAHERAEIEVPIQKLELTNVDAFYQLTLVRVPQTGWRNCGHVER